MVIGRPALVLPADVAGHLMRAPRQGIGGHPRHAGLQRRVDKQPQQPDVGLIYQQVVGAASQNNAVFRGGQFLDDLRLKAEQVPRGNVVVAVRRQDLAGIDLFGGGEHLLPADAFIGRAEKPLMDPADLRSLPQ